MRAASASPSRASRSSAEQHLVLAAPRHRVDDCAGTGAAGESRHGAAQPATWLGRRVRPAIRCHSAFSAPTSPRVCCCTRPGSSARARGVRPRSAPPRAARRATQARLRGRNGPRQQASCVDMTGHRARGTLPKPLPRSLPSSCATDFFCELPHSHRGAARRMPRSAAPGLVLAAGRAVGRSQTDLFLTHHTRTPARGDAMTTICADAQLLANAARVLAARRGRARSGTFQRRTAEPMGGGGAQVVARRLLSTSGGGARPAPSLERRRPAPSRCAVLLGRSVLLGRCLPAGSIAPARTVLPHHAPESPGSAGEAVMSLGVVPGDQAGGRAAPPGALATGRAPTTCPTTSTSACATRGGTRRRSRAGTTRSASSSRSRCCRWSRSSKRCTTQGCPSPRFPSAVGRRQAPPGAPDRRTHCVSAQRCATRTSRRRPASATPSRGPWRTSYLRSSRWT